MGFFATIDLKEPCYPGHGARLLDTEARVATRAMTSLAERGLLGVRELQSTFQLGLQDAVFGRQILVLRQQLLVHRPRDVGQDARPIHNRPLPYTGPRQRLHGPSVKLYWAT